MSNKKKYRSKFSTIVGLTTAAIMVLGLLLMFGGWKGSEEFGKPGSIRYTSGLILIGVAIVIITVMPLFPAKLRGVKEVSPKIKLIQILTMIFVWVILVGFGVLVYNCVQEPQNTLWCCIGAGIFAAGFAGAWIMVGQRDKLVKRGEADPDVHVVLRAETDRLENKVGETVLRNMFSFGEEGLSDEEREREIARIEQNTIGGVPMTKEQVEQYEDQRYGRK